MLQSLLSMRKVLIILIAVLALGGLIYLLFVDKTRISTKTPLTVMPSVVDESMSSLLASLEMELEKNRPEIIASLQPGITDAELEAAEKTLGRAIHPEMRALYRWHDGLANNQELFPGFEFWSLEESIRINQELTTQYQEKGVSLLMAHERNWLTVFPDPAGDGYYYDPSREYETGGVFYNFRETGYYQYFPSLKNLLKALVECYQAGAYPKDAEPDSELEWRIMDKYGLSVEK